MRLSEIGLFKYGKEEPELVKDAFQMAWPSVLESVFISLSGIVDSLMVSAIGAFGVAAVGLTTQPKFLCMAPFIAMSISVAALVARRRGEGDRRGANQVLLAALMIGLVLIALVTTLSLRHADFIIHFAGSEEKTHDSAVLYYKIIMGGFFFQGLSMILNASQRGSGNTKIAMRTNVTSNTVNMFGNWLLITGNLGFPAWGIRGAAIATVFGTVIACIMSVASVFRKDSYVNIPYIWENQVKPAIAPFLSIVKVGGSVFLEQVLMRTGFMAVAIMAAKQGTNNLAAHQVGMNIMSLSFSFGDGLQAAAVALIGMSLGAGQPERARKCGSICQQMGLCLAFVLSLVYLILGRGIYSQFFREKEIVDMGVQILRCLSVIVFLQITQVVYMGCLRGAGDVLYTTVASTISVTVVRTTFSYFFCYILGLGVIGIWFGIACDQLGRFLFSYFRFRAGKWTRIKI